MLRAPVPTRLKIVAGVIAVLGLAAAWFWQSYDGARRATELADAAVAAWTAGTSTSTGWCAGAEPPAELVASLPLRAVEWQQTDVTRDASFIAIYAGSAADGQRVDLRVGVRGSERGRSGYHGPLCVAGVTIR